MLGEGGLITCSMSLTLACVHCLSRACHVPPSESHTCSPSFSRQSGGHAKNQATTRTSYVQDITRATPPAVADPPSPKAKLDVAAISVATPPPAKELLHTAAVFPRRETSARGARDASVARIANLKCG